MHIDKYLKQTEQLMWQFKSTLGLFNKRTTGKAKGETTYIHNMYILYVYIKAQTLIFNQTISRPNKFF